MSFPGGAADKDGNRYEAKVGVLKLLEILGRTAVEIEIEPRGSENHGIEFRVRYKDGSIESHQVKRQIESKSGITLGYLKKSGILDSLWLYTEKENDYFCLTSTLSAGGIRELVNRCQFQTQDPHKSEDSFFAQTHLSMFNDIKEYYKKCEYIKDSLASMSENDLEEVIINKLSKFKCSAISEDNLYQWSIDKAKIFFKDPIFATNALRGFYEDSICRKVTYNDIEVFIKNSGLAFRSSTDDSTIETVKKTNQRFVQNHRRCSHEIPRDTLVSSIVKSVSNDSVKRLFVTGDAGSGKSHVLDSVINQLEAAEIPCLAIRVDIIEDKCNADELGKSLGFQTSPVATLMQIADGKACVLIIDQLDNVSVTSGNSAIKQSAVLDLLKESESHTLLTVILCCRSYQLKNDEELQKLKTKDSYEIAVPQFCDSDVDNALSKLNIQLPSKIEVLYDLLRSPLLYSMFIDFYHVDMDYSDIKTNYDLIEHYYKLKKERVGDNRWYNVIDTFFGIFLTTGELSVPDCRFDRCQSDLSMMLSEGVLIQSQSTISFFHQELLDFAFMKWFLDKGHKLKEFIVNSRQGLYLRTPIRMIVINLNKYISGSFEDFIIDLLDNEDIRPHVKQIILDAVKQLGFTGELLYNKLQTWESDPNLRGLPYFLYNHSLQWFDFLFDRGIIKQWWESTNIDLPNRAFSLLKENLPVRSDKIEKFLIDYVDSSEEWRRRVFMVVRFNCPDSISDNFFKIWIALAEKGTIRKYTDYGCPLEILIKSLNQYNQSHSLSILKTYYEELIDFIKGEITQTTCEAKWLIDEITRLPLDEILSLVKLNSVSVLDMTLPLYRLLTGNKDKLKKYFPEFYDDLNDPSYLTLTDVVNRVNKPIGEALLELAKEDTENFRQYMAELIQIGENSFTKLTISEAFADGDDALIPDAISYVCEKPERLILPHKLRDYLSTSYESSVSPSPNLSERLLRKISDHSNENEFGRIESAIFCHYIPSNSDLTKMCDDERTILRILRYYPEALLSKNARDTYLRIQEKNDRLYPVTVQVDQSHKYDIPHNKEQAQSMSEESWLNLLHELSINKHFNNLFSLIVDLTIENSEMFITIANQFTPQFDEEFIGAIFYGLQSARPNHDKVFELIRKFMTMEGHPGVKWIAEWIKSVAKEEIPSDILDFIILLTTQANDTTNILSEDEIDISEIQQKTIRGIAYETIACLIDAKPERFEQFSATLLNLINDRDPRVKYSAMSLINTLSLHSDLYRPEDTINLFRNIINESNDLILSHNEAIRFVYTTSENNPDELIDVIRRMVSSKYSEVREWGAAVVFACYINSKKTFVDLLKDCITGDDNLRIGIINQAIYWSSDPEYSDSSIEILESLLEKDINTVDKIRYMFDSKHQNLLVKHVDFVRKFIEKTRSSLDTHPLFKLMLSVTPTPVELIITATETVIKHVNDHIEDLYYVNEIPSLLQKAIENVKDDANKTKLLNLWDMIAGKYPQTLYQ